MKRRILVTAAGGTLAPLNIRLMKELRHAGVWVLGVDTRVDAAGRHFSDAFAQVPEGSAPGYVDAVVELIVKHRIDIVLPWSDEEALALAGQRARVETAGAILACAPFATLQIMSDKFATYELMVKAGVAMPAYVKTETAAALAAAVDRFAGEFGEFAMKPVTARGNRGTIVIRKDISGAQPYMGSRELHMDIETFRRYHLGEMPPSAIVMERLLAPAYDIDVLARNGKVLRAMPRRRLNPAGIPFTGGVLTPTKPLLELADRITEALNLSWLYDYDLMTNARGEAIPIEINPRPSGSIAAAIVAGVPFYDDLIAIANGEAIADFVHPREVAVIPYTDCRVVRADQVDEQDRGQVLKRFLATLQESDFTEAYVAWFRDPLVTRFLDARNISRDDAIDHWRRGRQGNAWHMYAICAAEDSRHVGNLKIGPIHWRHMISDMVTIIGDRSVWGQGRAREAIRLGIGIAFNELNIRKLSASIDSDNIGSIKAYTGAGFQIETSLKDQFMDTTQSPPRLSDKVYVARFNPAFRPTN